MIGITAYNKTYDGTTRATLNTTGAVLNGVVGSDDVTLYTQDAIGTFDNKEIGNNKTVYISGLDIVGTNISNYSLIQPITTASIGPVPPPPTPNPKQVNHATQETNTVITNSVTNMETALQVNDTRFEQIQARITAYAAALQKILTPPSANGLKVIVDGRRVYIGK